MGDRYFLIYFDNIKHMEERLVIAYSSNSYAFYKFSKLIATTRQFFGWGVKNQQIS
jgi:hypothetical protein